MQNLSLRKFNTVFFYVASFAVVLEAAPQFYPVRIDPDYDDGDYYHNSQLNSEPEEYRRIIRQPQQFHGCDKIGDQRPSEYFAIEDQNGNEEFYEPLIYEFQRLPRSGETSASNYFPLESIDRDFYQGKSSPGLRTIRAKPDRSVESQIVRYPQSSDMLYVVRPADFIDDINRENHNRVDDGDDFYPSIKSGRKLNPFPISMTKQEPSSIHPGRSLTDQELGRIVRKAINAAEYGENVHKEIRPVRRLQEPTRKIFRESELYKPQIRKIYPNDSIPRVIGLNTPRNIHEVEDYPLFEDFPNDGSFILGNSKETSAIGEGEAQKVEVEPAVVSDVSLSEAEPEVYQFVDDVVMTGDESGEKNSEDKRIDEVIEEDLILTEIEEDLGPTELNEEIKNEEENVGATATEVETSVDPNTEAPIFTTEEYQIPVADEKDLNITDEVDERPPTSTEISLTDETIIESSSTTPQTELGE